MKIKRYKEIKEYITDNNVSQEETQKIMIERPSEIVVIHNENYEMVGSLNLWHNRPDFNGKKTSYIGNVNIFEKYRKDEENIFNEIFESLKKEGIETIIGPLNGTTWNTYRYVTEKGNGRRFLLEPWNEDYYVSLFEEIGFKHLAGYISTVMEGMNSEGRKNLNKKTDLHYAFSFFLL